MSKTNYTKFIFTPNIFASVAWIFTVFMFAGPEFVKNILSQSQQSRFQENLMFFVAALLMIWNLMNEYTKYLNRNRLTLFFTLSRWLVIPLLVLFLVIYNGIFQVKLTDIDMNFSVFPIAAQMLLILVLTEILKFDFLAGGKRCCYALYVFLIFTLGTLNLFFCVYFVASWVAVYRSVVS